MKRLLKIIYLILIFTMISGQSINPPKPIIKEFKSAGKIEALMTDDLSDEWLLIQLDLKNDSLFYLVNNVLPDIDLLSGPASYHRIINSRHLDVIQNVLTAEYYSIINDNYKLPHSSREYWVDFKEGSETQGTWSDDDAIEYTCACLSGATDCVKLGWDESWWNPLDYWGEVWYGYQPPYYESIEEIRVTVRGAQCDDLPLWSETFMGMMDDNGNWSQNYELSIDYTDNEYIVNSIWSGNMIMPRIGSEDNYCIDHIKLEFYYNCNEPESPTNLLASDEEDCFTVNLEWNLPNSSITGQTLYRDGVVIAQLDINETVYIDWGAQAAIEHVYCIDSQNQCGSSEIICNPGSRKVVPDKPSFVNATDGEFVNEVLIYWHGVNAVDNYKIYRDNVWMGIVSSDQLEYIDAIAESDVIYEYCIEGVNDCGESEWQCDTGYTVSLGGDINDDGNIDILDIVVAVNIIIEIYEFSESEFLEADMNSDNVVDVLDIVILVNLILMN